MADPKPQGLRLVLPASPEPRTVRESHQFWGHRGTSNATFLDWTARGHRKLWMRPALRPGVTEQNHHDAEHALWNRLVLQPRVEGSSARNMFYR